MFARPDWLARGNARSGSMRRSNLTRLPALALLLAASGCPDPIGKFDEFVERIEALPEPDAGAPTFSCDEPTDLPDPEQLEGRYLFVVSTSIDPAKPFVYLLEVEAEREGDEYTITMRDQPLRADDRMTPIGEFGAPRVFEVSPSGCFTSDPTTFVIPMDANPILPVMVESTLVFSGNVATAMFGEDGDMLVNFWCGNVDGKADTPLGEMNVDGSTFTATRITDEENYPPVVINCAMEPAESL
jgi:hypothetical protein